MEFWNFQELQKVSRKIRKTESISRIFPGQKKNPRLFQDFQEFQDMWPPWVYKELNILKFPNLLYLHNCLFMSQTETNQRLANSFVDLRHCGDNHNYLTKSRAKGLFDIPFVNTQIYSTKSIKYNCIKDWNNFRNNFPHITLHKCPIH